MRLYDELEQAASETPVRDVDWIRAHLAVGDYPRALQRLRTVLDNKAPTDLSALTGLAANPFGDPELEKPEFQELFDRLWLD